MKARWYGRGLLWLVAVVLVACSKPAPPQEQVTPPIVETEVPVPEQLLAEGVIPTPNASWTKLQRNIGGLVGILPMTFGGLLFTLSGFDVLAGDVVDGSQPAYFAISSASLGAPAASGQRREPAPHYVFALRMIESRKARAMLLDGDRAMFTAEERGGMTRLRGKGARESDATMAMTKSGFLLVASSAADLDELGAYAYRNLPKKPLPSEALVVSMPRSVVRGMLRAKLGAAWAPYRDDLAQQDKQARAAHGGRAPDFGDPQAILGAIDGLVQKKLALLEKLESVRVALDPTDAELRLTATLEVAQGDTTFSQMVTGDASPLLSAPSDALVSVLYRDSEQERSADADAFAPWLASVVGQRLSEADTSRLRALHQAWAKGRGDALTVSFFGGGAQTPGVSACAKVQKPEAMKELFTGFPDLLRLKAIREPLKLKSVDVRPFDREGIKGSEIELYAPSAKGEASSAKAVKGGTPAISVAYSDAAPGERACLALTSDPVHLLANTAKPAHRLGDDAQTANMLGSLGERSRLVAAVHALSDAEGNPLPALVFAWGKSDQSGFARVQVTYTWVRELMRRSLKF
ncbi:MAG: hypothetical protein U0174_05525 [Polyangiaceae bacterium]